MWEVVMKLENWEPAGESEAIAWLIEEAQEAILMAARSLRFGIDNIHEQRPNREYLLDEIDDLLRAARVAKHWLEKGRR
jgi:hypothetical protein